MNSALVIDAPTWQYILLGTAAILGAVVLYRKTRGELGLIGQLALGLLRFTAFAGLAFLLLNPLLRNRRTTPEFPVALVLVDQSTSVLEGDTSAALRLDFRRWCAEAAEAWTVPFPEVRTEFWGFDDALFQLDDAGSPGRLSDAGGAGWTFAGQRTDLSSALADLTSRYESANLAGIVILSDGRITQGRDPAYPQSALDVPHFTVSLGDTAVQTDRWVDRVAHNEVAYLGNAFPVDITIGGTAEVGSRIRITVEGVGTGLVAADTVWTPRFEQDVMRFTARIPAEKLGRSRYRIQVANGSSERLLTNNERSFSVEVLERERRALVIAPGPRPDLGSFAQALVRTGHHRVDFYYLNMPGHNPESREASAVLTEKLRDADVVLMAASGIQRHAGAGTEVGPPRWLEAVENSGVPVLLWCDRAGLPKSVANSWLGERWGFEWGPAGFTHESHPAVVEGFSLFNQQEAILDETNSIGLAYSSSPPLTMAMGNWDLVPAWEVALTKQLGPIATHEITAAFRELPSGRRLGIVCGEGWWRMAVANGPGIQAGSWIIGAVKFLTSRDDIRRFRVKVPEELDEDAPLRIHAEVYDQALEPISSASVQFTLRQGSAVVGEGLLLPAGSGYELAWGQLPPGDYTWHAESRLSGEMLEDGGELTVQAVEVENRGGRANDLRMRMLAERTGGMYLGHWPDVRPEEWMAQQSEGSPAKTILHEEVVMDPLVSWWPLAVLILLALTIEWVTRRRVIGV